MRTFYSERLHCWPMSTQHCGSVLREKNVWINTTLNSLSLLLMQSISFLFNPLFSFFLQTRERSNKYSRSPTISHCVLVLLVFLFFYLLPDAGVHVVFYFSWAFTPAGSLPVSRCLDLFEKEMEHCSGPASVLQPGVTLSVSSLQTPTRGGSIFFVVLSSSTALQ